MREFEWIASLRQRLVAARADTRTGIGDDAAVVAPPPGRELVIATDTLIAGRHFPEDSAAADIGFKSVAVNLSDLAAMGADPAWLTVALAAPALHGDWCHAFIDGALAAIGERAVDIVGGDTTHSETLSITVTALGTVPQGTALRRDAARAGDLIAITGSLGDAAAGLACWPYRHRANADEQALIARLTRPSVRAGANLRGVARAAVDVSDGLLADLGHILAASRVGARVEIDALPCSSALARYAANTDERRRLQAGGGDDYELCITLDPARLAAAWVGLDCPLTVIGRIEPGSGLKLLDANGRELAAGALTASGWDHFDGR